MEEENGENLRFKLVSGIDRQTRNLTIFQNVHVVELNHMVTFGVGCYFNCIMLYTCLVSFEVLQFSNANRIVSSPRKVQDFCAPKFILKPRALAFPGQSSAQRLWGREYL